jgi:hypothetical protein
MKMKLLFPLSALALAVAVAGCNKAGKLNDVSKAPLPTGPVELKLKWPQGERVVQDMEMKTTTETTIPGRPAPMQQNMAMGQKYGLTVLSANPDGGHEVEMEFLSSHMSMEMAGKKMMDFDSAQQSAGDATNPVAGMFGKMVGAKLEFFMDASNNVDRIEGVDAMVSRMAASAPPGGMAAMKSMMSEGYFKQMMSSSRFMPPNAVAPGDSWPVQLEYAVEPLGTLVLDYTFTLENWEKHGKRNCARLTFTGTIKTKPGSASSMPGMAGMTMTIQDGTTAGTSWFDPELGITIDTTMNQDMTMVIHLPKNPNAQTGPMSQPQTLTSHLNQDMSIKLDSVN